MLKKVKIFCLLNVVLCLNISIHAMNTSKWYAGLKDMPGVTIEEFSEIKLLPVEFLRKAGLVNKEEYKRNSHF